MLFEGQKFENNKNTVVVNEVGFNSVKYTQSSKTSSMVISPTVKLDVFNRMIEMCNYK